MTRDELIAALQAIPENLPVFRPDGEDYWPEITRVEISLIEQPDWTYWDLSQEDQESASDQKKVMAIVLQDSRP